MNEPIVLPDRESWLKFRGSHIGGSDVASIVGANPYKSTYSLWAAKTGLVEEPDIDFDGNEKALWGKILEEPIALEYARRTGRTLVNPGPWTVRVHEKYSFIAVTLDREIVYAPDKTGPGVYEGKTTGFFQGKSWREGVPLMPQIQLQHGLAVTGWQWGSIACLIAGQSLEPVDLDRNDALIEMIEDRCAWFWDLVERRVAPPIDDSESTERTLKLLHPKDNGEKVALPPEATEWATALQTVKAEIANLEARKTGLTNSLRAAIGDATYGHLSDGASFSLRTVSVKGHTVKPSEYRKLVYHQPGKVRVRKVTGEE